MINSINLAMGYLKEKDIKVEHVYDGIYDVSDMLFLRLSELNSLYETEEEREKSVAKTVGYYRKNFKYDEAELANIAAAHRSEKCLASDFLSKLEAIVAACENNICYLGRAYQKNDEFLFARKPEKAKCKKHGDGFEGHGTAVVLEFDQPPKALMILGEDD